jgi:hypothetical protein
MQRLGRIGALVIVLGLVLWGSTGALPGLVDATDDEIREECQYTYLVFEVQNATDDEQASAVAYENLSADRRAAFDTYLDTEDGQTVLDRVRWNELNEQPEPIHYVAHEGALYRAQPVLQQCSSWERYGNGTIP